MPLYRMNSHDGRDRDTGERLLELFETYRTKRTPVALNFRAAVPWIPYGERATHFMHSYPAKLLPHIPHFFLANRVLSSAETFVLDPFGGSGTVALEAMLLNRNAVTVDVNPLAHLIAR